MSPQTPEQYAAAIEALKSWRPARETLMSSFTSFPIPVQPQEQFTFNVPRPEAIMQELRVDMKTTVHINVTLIDMETIREHQKELQAWMAKQVEKSMLIGLLWPYPAYRAPAWKPTVGTFGRGIYRETCS